MLDWHTLFFNSLWVLAAALALAAFSHAAWQARQSANELYQVWMHLSYRHVFYLAGGLFCLGLAGLVDETWRQIAFSVLAAACLGLLVRSLSKPR